ncbi:MAG: biotin/lipoate A/B protein ligase family protein [Nitrospiria bacterium]
MDPAPWRLIVDPPQSAAVNMAADEAIALAFSEGKSPQTVRFYQWNVPSFSIGTFQKLDAHWLAALEEQGIPFVRRITGGRGILHDQELTYAVVAATTNPRFSGGVKGAFLAIAQGILTGLRCLGLEDLEISKTRLTRENQKKPLCYDSTSQHEITAKSRKLAGSAQRRWQSHFLQHGSLILKHSMVDFYTDKFPEASLISKNQVALSDLLPALPPLSTLIEHLTKGFEATLNIALHLGEYSGYEQVLIQRLICEKYGTRGWNQNRKTAGDGSN